MPREEYEVEFNKILAGLDPAEIARKVGPTGVMLCWESPNVYCHRRIVAEWLEGSLGVVVNEIGFERHEIMHFGDMPEKDHKPAAKKVGKDFGSLLF